MDFDLCVWFYFFLISSSNATVISFAITEAFAQFSSKFSVPLYEAVSVMHRKSPGAPHSL